LQERQAKQLAGKNHENKAHGLETEALSNCGDQMHRSEENCDTHVLVSVLSGFCTLIDYLRSLFTQTKKQFVLRVVVIGHEYRTGWRLRIVERVRPQPGCEGRSVFVAKAPLEELRRLILAVELRGNPTVESIALVDALLSCQGGKAFSSNPEPTRFGVLLCAFPGPLCRLVPAPCRGHGNESEYQRF